MTGAACGRALGRAATTVVALAFAALAFADAPPGEGPAADAPQLPLPADEALRGHWGAELLILFGCVFILAAALGMLRFPDFYTRLHASTKLVTLGGIGIFGGAALAFAAVDSAERVLLIAAFFFLTAPLSGYMIARSGYLRGLKPYREASSIDEWDACGSLAEDPR